MNAAMIFGTGVDIIAIARIGRSMEKYRQRFEEKIFTAGEIAYCRSQPDPAKHFAVRFAAKEAVLKCLGTGMAPGIAWKDMEVIRDPRGRPHLHMRGKGRELMSRLNVKVIHLSLSHDDVYAIAHAIAEY